MELSEPRKPERATPPRAGCSSARPTHVLAEEELTSGMPGTTRAKGSTFGSLTAHLHRVTVGRLFTMQQRSVH